MVFKVVVNNIVDIHFDQNNVRTAIRLVAVVFPNPNSLVELPPHDIASGEDMREGGVEATRQYVLCYLPCPLPTCGEFCVGVQELVIVRQGDHHWGLEHVLQPPAKKKKN